MGANAPFRGMRWQPLTAGVALGQLMFIPEKELAKATLGPDIIVVTDAVPNDIPLVAGLITEAFQSPLAHVNVLSQSRGTPNLAVRDARKDPQIAALLGELVRLELGADGYHLQKATATEVQVHVHSRTSQGPQVKPRIDLSVRGLVDLADRGLEDLPSIGAKAAQLAELGRVRISDEACAGSVPLPAAPFAVPIAHYAEHFEKSGAREMFEGTRFTSDFNAGPEARARVLEQMRDAIEQTPLDPELLDALKQRIASRFGGARLRFRSSSNSEDLADFNGAGLYESWAAALDDDERPIEDALRSVWASLWTARAYDERSYGVIDQASAWCARDIEAKLVGEERRVVIKQARPFNFGRAERPVDCREY